MTLLPHQGEREALRGFGAQYFVAAAKAYHHLNDNSLGTITLAAAGSGRIDDFVIDCGTNVFAHQVKWSRHPGSVTFFQLVHGSTDGKPSIIRQLADGWIQLREQFPGKNITVKWITNDSASTSSSANIPLDDDGVRPGHFASFVEDLDADESTPKKWSNAIAELKAASGLEDDKFKIFLGSCTLEFSKRFDFSSSPDRERIHADVSAIQNFFIAEAINGRFTHSQEDLLRVLGWDKATTDNNNILQLVCPLCKTSFEHGIRICPGPNCGGHVIYGATDDEVKFVLAGCVIAVASITHILSGRFGGNLFSLPIWVLIALAGLAGGAAVVMLKLWRKDTVRVFRRM